MGQCAKHEPKGRGTELIECYCRMCGYSRKQSTSSHFLKVRLHKSFSRPDCTQPKMSKNKRIMRKSQRPEDLTRQLVPVVYKRLHQLSITFSVASELFTRRLH